MSVAAVSVGNTATLIIAENFNRIRVIIDNQGSQVVYLGDDDTVTTSNGITLAADDKLIMTFGGGVNFPFFFRGDIYGIVASGTADVRVWEMVETRS